MSVLIFVDHLDGHIKKASHEALSYGAKIAEQTGDTAESVITRADRALYLAKNIGKNRVVSQKALIPGDAVNGQSDDT